MKIKKGCNAQKRTMQQNLENVKSDANVPTTKDICKVFHFFRYLHGSKMNQKMRVQSFTTSTPSVNELML